MPDELEERLARTLRSMPPPAADATERALRAALEALPPAAEARRRRRRRLLVPAVACTVAFVFGGVTLAATGGRLPLVGTPAHHHHPTRTHAHAPRAGVVLPRGAIAFSVAAGGRTWLATSGGAALHGRPLRTLAVSPGAINLLEGADHTLIAIATGDGHVAFTRTLPGPPLAAAWAPAGIRIAYTVHTGTGDRLYDMFGDGRHRFLVAGRTSGAAPSWRWDSEAFAYIRADGRPMVHDVIDGATSPVGGCGIRRAVAVAFAPYGGALARADRAGRVAVDDTLGRGRRTCLAGGTPGVPKLAWLRPGQLVAGVGDTLTRYSIRIGGSDVTRLPGQVAGIVAAPGGRRLALALRDADGDVRVVEARTPRFSEAATPLHVIRTLIDLGPVTGPVALSWQ
jgi:hypothetical protein